MSINVLQEKMTDAQVAVMDSVRGVLADARVDTNVGSNILVSLLADISDSLDEEHKDFYRAKVFAAFDTQVAHLATQQNIPTK